MQKQKSSSVSTDFRYKKVNRQKDLIQFIHFRNQFQNHLNKQKIQQLKTIYQHGICGKNAKGHLVVADKVGSVKINQVFKLIDQDDLVAYFNQRLIHISQHLLQKQEQILWIVDLNGKIMQLASKKVLSLVTKIIKNLQNYFPEILYKLYLVNTPMLFDTIWNKFSDQITEQTQQKIIMLGDQLDSLYQQVELSILPQFLGGQIKQLDFLNGYQSKTKQTKNNQDNLNKNDQQQQESSEQEQQFDFSSLKNALSGMKMGGSHLQSNSQTPLNTEADER